MSALGIDGGRSTQGSVNSSHAVSQSNSQTFGSQASAQAVANMNAANQFTSDMWEKAAAFNAMEAQKNRDWQERMANTTYQRTVKDMIAAGINPILAAGAGLSADSVSGSAIASMGGATGAMAAATPDSISSSYGASESKGSSWGESESGLAVGLQMLGEAIAGAINSSNTAQTIPVIIQEAGTKAKDTWNDMISELMKRYPKLANFLGAEFSTESTINNSGGGHRKKTVSGTTTIGRSNAKP